MTAPYRADAEGRLRPEVPPVGPCGQATGGCRIQVHHWRPRKTGPRFPLAFCRCLVHHDGFTVYPPGHVPYGRVPVLRCAPDGGGVRGGDDPLRGTLFEAAVDAARGEEWPYGFAFATGAGGVRSTQRRWLQRLTVLVGVDAVVSQRGRLVIAQALGVGVVLLSELAKEAVAGLRSRGSAVLRVLTKSGSSLSRLAVSGFLGRLWGQPFRVAGCVLRRQTRLKRPPLAGPG